MRLASLWPTFLVCYLFHLLLSLRCITLYLTVLYNTTHREGVRSVLDEGNDNKRQGHVCRLYIEFNHSYEEMCMTNTLLLLHVDIQARTLCRGHLRHTYGLDSSCPSYHAHVISYVFVDPVNRLGSHSSTTAITTTTRSLQNFSQFNQVSPSLARLALLPTCENPLSSLPLLVRLCGCSGTCLRAACPLLSSSS